jgi:hypothetical protein
MPKILTDAAVRKYRGGKTRREIRDGGVQGLFLIVYCGPVLRHAAEPTQAANCRSSTAS